MSRVNLLITFASFAAMSILIAFLLTVLLPEPAAPPDQTLPPAQDAAPSQPLSQNSSDGSQYLLKEQDGKLAVYTMPWQEGDLPQMVLDVPLSTLPPYDQGQLRIGVPIRDYEELVQRIEDYIS